ncbi:MAG: hypothetical protein AB1705_25860 [Verrucomicrobiota bacterium]
MFSLFKKKQPATESDFAVKGKVSVWIGDFDSEDALLDYVESDDGCGEDFGCVLRDRRELSVETQPRPVSELLQGFSWSREFIDEIVAQAGAGTQARCAVVSYASDYRLLGVTPKATARLRFIGVASFGETP